MSAKFYFREDSEDCFTLEAQRDYMRENDLTEMIVFEAVRDYIADVVFCKYFSDFIEFSDICGHKCEYYRARNKKSGICCHHGFAYDQGKKRILRLNTEKK